MDKEPSFLSVLLWAVGSALFAFVAARFKPWALILVLPFPLFLAFGLLSEILDPFVGHSIRLEAGLGYIAVAWAAPIFVLLASILGLFLRHHSRKAA